MPLNKDLHKVMVIGSGPIIIGQAAEFDYAGSQACKALKEQGLEVVLVNSNPATLMTDHSMADHIYIEPLTVETVQRIIEKEACVQRAGTCFRVELNAESRNVSVGKAFAGSVVCVYKAQNCACRQSVIFYGIAVVLA